MRAAGATHVLLATAAVLLALPATAPPSRDDEPLGRVGLYAERLIARVC